MGLVSKGHTFSAAQTIVASEHNTNFDTLYNLANGAIDNDNLSASASIANSKLAAGKSYYSFALTSDGQYTSGVTSLRTFQMPFAATWFEVSACARVIDTADGTEVYTVDVLEAGVSVLSSVINLVASDTPVVGVISDSSVADNAKVTVDLSMGGTSAALDDLTVFLTFKVSHIS